MRPTSPGSLTTLPGPRGSGSARRRQRTFSTLRSHDGSDASSEYAAEEKVGRWRPTPPDAKAAAEPHWAKVRPFAVVDVKHYLPLPPPEINSIEYANALEEVKAFGSARSTTRSADQTEIAKFWAQDTVIAFNAIARDLSRRHNLSLKDNARLFALLNIAIADARIVAWDTKYRFGFWRPVTAIRLAADDGNRETRTDPSWEPLIATPPHPDYVSGHSITGAAGAAVLREAFGDRVEFRVGSDTLPGTTRTFWSLTKAAEENGMSRIYGGIHFPFANRAGLTAGDQVGDFVSTLLPRHTEATHGPQRRGPGDRRRRTDRSGDCRAIRRARGGSRCRRRLDPDGEWGRDRREEGRRVVCKIHGFEEREGSPHQGSGRGRLGGVRCSIEDSTRRLVRRRPALAAGRFLSWNPHAARGRGKF